MRILIHIGQSKTGTSAIQAFLTLQRPTLKLQGVLYPMITRGGMPLDMGNHNPVADALCDVSRYPGLTVEDYFDFFFKEAQECNAETMILSAEHFFGGEPRVWNLSDPDEYYARYTEKIQRLAVLLGSNLIEILVYLRPQVHWLASAITQTISIERLIRPQRIYYDDVQFFQLVRPLLRYYTLLKIWETQLQPSKIQAVVYHRPNFHQHNSVADFLQRAGISFALPEDSRGAYEINPSFSREYIEVKKVLNQHPHSEYRERAIIDCLRRLSAKSNNHQPYTLAGDLIGEIHRFVERENQLLNQHYLSGEQPLQADIPEMPQGSDGKRLILDAQTQFQNEFRKPRYRLIEASYAVRGLLRQNFPVLQALVHQIKRFSWKLRRSG